MARMNPHGLHANALNRELTRRSRSTSRGSGTGVAMEWMRISSPPSFSSPPFHALLQTLLSREGTLDSATSAPHWAHEAPALDLPPRRPNFAREGTRPMEAPRIPRRSELLKRRPK
eukprot:8489873-Pyramimonas_sp.AAC.1